MYIEESENISRRHESLPFGLVLLDIERQRLENRRWKLSEIALVHSEGEEHHSNPGRTTLNRVLEKI
ncbi:MAG: hypothetical protein ACHBN1_07540 [Heteroscytonema crispum UTEX LB 1556]